MKSEILIYLPLPCRYGDQLTKSLRAHSKYFQNFGVHAPDSKIYTDKLSYFLNSDENRLLTPVGRRNFLEKIGAYRYKRIVLSLSREHIGRLNLDKEDGLLPKFNIITERLTQLFKGWKLKFVLGVINVGSIVSMSYDYSTDYKMLSHELYALPLFFWADALGACMDEFPKVQIEVWKHEDAYCQWPGILRRIGNVPDGSSVPGALDMVENYLERGARSDLRDHIRRLPPQNDYHFAKIIRAYNGSELMIEKFIHGSKMLMIPNNVIRAFDALYCDDIELIRNDKNLYLFDF